MFEVLYLDNHILVVDKKGNIPVQDDLYNKNSLESLLKDFLKEKYKKKGNVFLHPIYRIDKKVRGLVLFARTSKALSRLNKGQRERKIKKMYLARVEGILDENKELNHFHKHIEYRAKISSHHLEGFKKVCLKYRVLKTEKSISFLQVELVTGRYHQIRAQFGYVGHPVVGDKKYGSKEDLDMIELICSKLEFVHPVKDEKMCFSVDFL